MSNEIKVKTNSADIKEDLSITENPNPNKLKDKPKQKPEQVIKTFQITDLEWSQ